jgi:hypothetical protein
VRVLDSLCSSSLMLHHCRGRCYVQALGSCGGCHCGMALELHLALPLSALARAFESVEFLIC